MYAWLTPDNPILNEDYDIPTSSVNEDIFWTKAVGVYVVELPETELVKEKEQSVRFAGVEKPNVIKWTGRNT